METNDGRQQWKDEAIKCILDTCLEEVQRIGKNGQSLLKVSWAKLGKKLKEKFGMNLTQKQIRNAFDTLKAKYVGWCYLKNKTGNLYNPQTNMFTLTPQEWKEFKKGAIGALDGTLIHVIVPVEKQHLYRGRGKDDCYQNVLAIYDFNMVFTFLMVGWEGIAYDSRILSESLTNANAPFPLPPPDKYYLCDAAHAHTRGFMAPYRNVRYWLGDFRLRRALNNKEKFNYAHAKLRNVIERAYGVLKARFPILKKMSPFSLVTQRNVMIACFVLHNFIRKEGLSDELFDEYDQPNVRLQDGVEHVQDGGEDREEEVVRHGSSTDREFMSQL